MSQQKQLGCVGIGCLPILIILAVGLILDSNAPPPPPKPTQTPTAPTATRALNTEPGIYQQMIDRALKEGVFLRVTPKTQVTVSSQRWQALPESSKKLYIGAVSSAWDTPFTVRDETGSTVATWNPISGGSLK